MMPTNFHRILLLRLSSIGDVILTTPFLRRFKAVYPDCEIDYVVKKEYAELLRDNPHIARLIEFDAENGMAGLLELRKQLAKNRYDLVFDLHDNFRTLLLRRNPGAAVHVFRKRTLKKFLLVRFRKNLLASDPPVAERYMETARRYGIRPDDLGPEVTVSESIARQALIKLTAAGWTDGSRIIGICPGSRHFTKRWPGRNWMELCRTILERSDYSVIVFGGPDDCDTGGELAAIDRRRIFDLCGVLTLPETAAAMSHCAAVVANDSGLMHLATARRIPVLAIFGGTTRELGFFPYNSKASVLEANDLPCRPCHHIGRPACPEKHFACMERITAEMAWMRLADLLAV
jgi:lipopolysaccharide heptosyltransferase II